MIRIRPLEDGDREWLATRLGYALVRRDGNELEVVAIACKPRRRGAGKALLGAAREEAQRRGCRRAWLVTTNDNVDAIAFYLRCGWNLVAVHREALEESRRLKPEIPHVGEHGLPLRDELEFELPTRTG